MKVCIDSIGFFGPRRDVRHTKDVTIAMKTIGAHIGEQGCTTHEGTFEQQVIVFLLFA
jgi:hypothetical protein